MAVSFKCERCGKIITGKDEFDAEIKFIDHACEGMRDLNELPVDLLRKVARGEITAEEAWAIKEEREGVK
ncbi:MAG: hypothetical protein P8175_07075 [Deltaproteobacteria bacterium]